MSRPQVTELRVRYAETDQMGVVYHANYLAWCEVGRTDWIRAAGMSYRTMEQSGVGLAVADLQMRFHASATYDDAIRVETWCTEVRSRTVSFDYLVRHAESGARLVSVSTRLVCVDREGRMMALPAEVRRFLDAALEARSDGRADRSGAEGAS